MSPINCPSKHHEVKHESNLLKLKYFETVKQTVITSKRFEKDLFLISVNIAFASLS
jgi:hypothetical protein